MDQKWSLVSPTRAHSLTAKFVSLGGQPMSQCIKAARMNTHMIELGLGAMKVFQICTSRLAWWDSFEAAVDGVGGGCRLVPLSIFWRWNKAFTRNNHPPTHHPRFLLDYTSMLLLFLLLLKKNTYRIHPSQGLPWKLTSCLVGASKKRVRVSFFWKH